LEEKKRKRRERNRRNGGKWAGGEARENRERYGGTDTKRVRNRRERNEKMTRSSCNPRKKKNGEKANEEERNMGSQESRYKFHINPPVRKMRETNESQYNRIKERYRMKKQAGEPYDILPYLYTKNLLSAGE